MAKWALEHARKWRGYAALGLCVGLLAGCGGEDGAPQVPPPKVGAIAPLSTAEVLQAGQYGVGVTTRILVDTSRPTIANGDLPGLPFRMLVTEIWYPAAGDPGAPERRNAPLAAAGRPYPLVVYCHGFMSNRGAGGYLARHLASHGFLVAAPDFPLTHDGAPGGVNFYDLAEQPGDVSFLIDQILVARIGGDAAFDGPGDAPRIGLAGLSLGGSTALLATYHPNVRDGRIEAAASMAGGACSFNAALYGDRRIPLMIVHGDIDALVDYPASAVHGFESANPPKYLVTLRKGSHVGFIDGVERFSENANNPDDLGCAGFDDSPGPDDPVGIELFTRLLGGVAWGIGPSGCPASCPAGPRERAMRPSRQQALTVAAVAPFFEATLRGDQRARAYIEGALATDNADLTVEFRR